MSSLRYSWSFSISDVSSPSCSSAPLLVVEVLLLRRAGCRCREFYMGCASPSWGGLLAGSSPALRQCACIPALGPLCGPRAASRLIFPSGLVGPARGLEALKIAVSRLGSGCRLLMFPLAALACCRFPALLAGLLRHGSREYLAQLSATERHSESGSGTSEDPLRVARELRQSRSTGLVGLEGP